MSESGCNQEPTDIELIERIRAGSMDAFDALVNRYRQGIYRLAFAMTQDHEAADDLSQEAFVQAFRRIRQLREAESVGPWIRRILMNLCIRHSKAKRLAPIDESLPAPSSDGPARVRREKPDQAQRKAGNLLA